MKDNNDIATLKRKFLLFSNIFGLIWFSVFVLPQLYYYLYVPEIAFPDFIMQWFQDSFPAIGHPATVGNKPMQIDDMIAFENAYLFDLIYGTLCIIGGVWCHIITMVDRKAYAELAGGEILKMQQWKFRRGEQTWVRIIMTVGAIAVVHFLWQCLYTKMVTLFVLSIPLSLLIILLRRIPEIYILNDWKISKQLTE